MRKESACPTKTPTTALPALTTPTAPPHRRTSGGLARSSTARRPSASAGVHSTTRAASASRRSSPGTPAVAPDSKRGSSHCRIRRQPGITNRPPLKRLPGDLPPRRADPRRRGVRNHPGNRRGRRNLRRHNRLPGISVANPWGQARTPDRRRHPPRPRHREGNPRPRPAPSPGKSAPISKLRKRSRNRVRNNPGSGHAGRNPGPRWRGRSRGSNPLASSRYGRTPSGRSKAGNNSAGRRLRNQHSRHNPRSLHSRRRLRAWRPFPRHSARNSSARSNSAPNKHVQRRARKRRGRTSSRPTSRPATWPRYSKATSTHRLPLRRIRLNRLSGHPPRPGLGGLRSHRPSARWKTG